MLIKIIWNLWDMHIVIVIGLRHKGKEKHIEMHISFGASHSVMVFKGTIKLLVVTLLTTKKEYIIVGDCVTRAIWIIWLKIILKVMHHLQNTLAKYFMTRSLQLCIVKIVFSWGPKHVDNHFHKIQKFCSNLKSVT